MNIQELINVKNKNYNKITVAKHKLILNKFINIIEGEQDIFDAKMFKKKKNIKLINDSLLHETGLTKNVKIEYLNTFMRILLPDINAPFWNLPI